MINNLDRNVEALKRAKKQPAVDGFNDMGLHQQVLVKNALQRLDNTAIFGTGYNWANAIRDSIQISLTHSYISRFMWTNVPFVNCSEMQIEMMLYKHGKLGIFYDSSVGFIISPIAYSSKKDSAIVDHMGNIMEAYPVPSNGAGEVITDEKVLLLSKIGPKKVLWDIPLFSENTSDLELLNFMESHCILLFDNTPMYQGATYPRMNLDEPFVNGLVESIVLSRSATINSIGTSMFRVDTADEAQIIDKQMVTMEQLILKGKRYFPFGSGVQTQDITPPLPASINEFWLNYQSIKNLRDNLCGIPNDGVIQKDTYQNQADITLDIGASGGILVNGWKERLRTCIIFNSLFGMNMMCESVSSPIPPAGSVVDASGQESKGEQTDVADKSQ